MLFRSTLLLRVVSAMAIALAIAGAPGLSHAASTFSLPPAGLGSVALVNQDTGANEVLTVNFAGTTYSVAPQGNASNQVEFNIAPGTYSYTASVAGIGNVNGTVTVPLGHVISLAFVDNAADMANADQNGDDQTVVVQQVVNNNEDENNEDNDNDHENNEGESNKLQSKENSAHQEVSESNESAEAEGAEHDSSVKNDDGVTTTVVDPPKGKGKVVTNNATNVTTTVVDPPKGKGKVVTNNVKPLVVPFNAGKVTTSGGGDKPSGGKTNDSNLNVCAPGSPLFPVCAGGSSGHSKGKKGDLLTISFTPTDNSTPVVVANDGSKHDKDSDDEDNESNEGNETSIVNVTQPAVDNDELLVTITDVTSQAQ